MAPQSLLPAVDVPGDHGRSASPGGGRSGTSRLRVDLGEDGHLPVWLDAHRIDLGVDPQGGAVSRAGADTRDG